ncbi:hypothetical protein SAMN05920897_101163 [Alkalispirochaeta americana]|uniref:Tetratricopeptide repeat-containing protein n=1 Tax=Alkalispirochaeta americana TaxID=159291 RepID=A0A1N6NB01_9SPIO|nr:hypothetical protein [Alkalispirochaeta americana]SIP89259.1 hypothetical protein SAMN05920897_101163 [Alkalispirochaeta americana]
MNRRTSRFFLIFMIAVAVTGPSPLQGETQPGETPPREQTDEARQEVFAPFVSRLRVALRDPQIRLTWRDSQDLPGGTYRIYRHTREITPETFPGAQHLHTTYPGVETYLDTPPEVGSYFYAVVAVDSEDQEFPVFVPFRNKTIRPVKVSRLDTEEDRAARVYDLVAQPQDTVVVLRFTPSRGGRELAIYRSLKPLTDDTALAEATLLERIDSDTRRFVDHAIPGVAYYYGVFDTSLVERGSVEIVPGSNVLRESTEIPLRGTIHSHLRLTSPPKRPAPLPMLELSSEAVPGSHRLIVRDIPYQGQPQELHPETRRSLARLLEDAPRDQLFNPIPRILPQERDSATEGTERTVAQVITGHFEKGDYARTTELLRNILELPLSQDLEHRVRFYLGQALYFDGRREPAFAEFLLAARGPLSQEVRPWTEGILQRRTFQGGS